MPKQLNSRCKELVASLIHYFELECENNGPLSPVTAIREVTLYGVSSIGEPLYIIQEYMENGCLLNYLKEDQGKTLKLKDLLFIAYQVASGMEYLESYNFIHRDLAARNILLSGSNEAKICDFGLSRHLLDEEYCAVSDNKFPIKWTAPEAILEGRFSTKSDVWSFGILLMELFTWGEQPYNGIKSADVVRMLLGGYRLPKPKHHKLPDELYQVMKLCWDTRPACRPAFKDLTKYFFEIDIVKDQHELVVNQMTRPYEYYIPGGEPADETK